MKIKGDAQTSARMSTPTYEVAEEDRSVVWTLSVKDLEEMKEWDVLPAEIRRLQLSAWLGGRQDALPAGGLHLRGGELQPAPLDWFEQHALVARNSLRNFLGIPTS